MKLIVIILAALLPASAMAQNMGAPRGDYDLYISDRAAWVAKRAAAVQPPTPQPRRPEPQK